VIRDHSEISIKAFPLLLVLCAAFAGCGGVVYSPPSRSVAQERDRGSDRTSYPRRTVLLHNIQRVCDPTVSPQGRITSARVVEKMTHPGDDFAETQLFSAINQRKCPQAVGRVVLEILLKRDHPLLTSYVIALLPNLDADDPMVIPFFRGWRTTQAHKSFRKWPGFGGTILISAKSMKRDIDGLSLASAVKVGTQPYWTP